MIFTVRNKLPIFVFSETWLIVYQWLYSYYLIKETSYHEDPFIINYLSILNSWPCAPIMRIIYAIYLYVFDTRIPLENIYSQTLKATKGIREASIYLCPWLHIMAHWDLCPKFLSLNFHCNCKGVLGFQTRGNRICLFVALLFSRLKKLEKK